MGSESVRVMILGKEYTLRTDGGDAETLREVAQYVNFKITEFWREVPSKEEAKVAVLAALNIAGELFEVRAKYEEVREKYEAETKKVEDLVDKVKSLNKLLK